MSRVSADHAVDASVAPSARSVAAPLNSRFSVLRSHPPTLGLPAFSPPSLAPTPLLHLRARGPCRHPRLALWCDSRGPPASPNPLYAHAPPPALPCAQGVARVGEPVARNLPCPARTPPAGSNPLRVSPHASVVSRRVRATSIQNLTIIDPQRTASCSHTNHKANHLSVSVTHACTYKQ